MIASVDLTATFVLFNLNRLFTCFFSMKYLLLLLWLIGMNSVLKAQELVTTNYGLESALQTNRVYHLYYSKDDLLYICTENGLFSYNGLTFKRHPLVNGQIVELTNAQEDEQGTIMAHDFSGNVYQLNKEGLLELYPLSDKIEGKVSGLFLSGNNRYFLTRKNLYVESDNRECTEVKPNVEVDLMVAITGNSIAEIQKVGGARNLYQLSDDQLIPIALKYPIKTERFNRAYQDSWCEISPDRKIWDAQGNLLVDLAQAPITVQPLFVRKIQGRVMVACKNGLYEVANNQVFFRGQYITGIEEDREGNIWVATLNGGVYKVQNINYQVYLINDIKRRVDFVYVDSNNLLYADLIGDLYQYKKEENDFECFHKSVVKATVKNLFFHEPSQLYISSGSEINTFDTSFQLLQNAVTYGAIEELSINDNFYHTRKASVVSFNFGWKEVFDIYGGNMVKSKIVEIHPQTGDLETYINESGNHIFFLRDPNVKLTKVWKEQIVYLLNDSLYFLNAITFEQQNKGYYPNIEDIMVEDQQLILVDSAAIFEMARDGKIIKSIPRKYGLNQNIIHTSSNEQYLCLTTRLAIHILDKKDWSYLYQFTSQSGIASVDFTKAWLLGGYLYVNGSKGITKINLLAQHNKGNPRLELAAVVIDSQLQSGTNFAYTQNNIELQFAVKSYTTKGSINWRINGRNWQQLTDNNKVILNDLQSGQYSIEAVFRNDLGASSKTIIYEFKIEKPYWEEFWFWLTIMGIAAVLGWFWYRRRFKQIQAQNDLKNQLTASQMTALKSQMNPHFIFNALNSIQSLIRFNKNKEAYKYINKFAVLLRETLYYSDKDFIPLEREISMLGNYLEMEKMRFDGALDFSVQVDCSTDIHIPSMIIQPFVENAIKHGLLHKTEGQKQVRIHFEEQDENSILCTVIDNGIGRKRAREITAQKKGVGASFSTNATQKRLELLQQSQHSQLGVSYTDLYDKDQQALGTKVEIVIPAD